LAKSLTGNLNWNDLRARTLAPAGAKARAWGGWIRDNDPVYGAARRPGPREIWTCVVAMLLVTAVVLFVVLFDWNLLRGPIGRWASAKYDREVAIQGDLDVNLFSWTPSVEVNRLKFGGPDWAREKDTANVEKIEASVRLRRLFAGQVEVPRLAITRPDVTLIATEDGKQSWDLNPGAPDTGEGMKLPLINQLIITDGHVSLDEQRRRMTLDAVVNAREAVGAEDPNAGFSLHGDGALNGAPLTLRINGGAFINIRRDRPYHFTADLRGARSHLAAEGSVTRPFDLGQFQSTLTLEGQDLADLYVLIGIPTPNTPPYRLSGTLSRDDALWRFNDFDGRVGASDLSGDLKVDKVDDRNRVEAQLVSRRLDLDDMLAIFGARTQTTAAGDTTTVSSGVPGKLLPDAPLQTERLRSMDGTLTYRAETVKANDLDIRQVNLGAELENGILNLDPVSFNFNRGELNGTARINAQKDVPYSAIDFRLAGYPLESIIPAAEGSVPLSGRALGRARLEGPGASIHDFAAGSKGSVSLVVPQGQMRAAFAELLGINASAGLRKLLSGDESTTEIRCAVADFNVSGGIARAQTLTVDTGVVLAKGTGTVNLGAETFALRIDGETKKPRLLRVWAPITVAGGFTSPRIGIDVGSAIAQGGVAAALGAVISPIGALLAFVDPGLAKDANCGALIASAR